MTHFQMVAVEPQLDGTDEIITSADCHNMKLPFQYGWDHWSIHQDGKPIFHSNSYRRTRHMLQALSSIQLMEAA